VQPIAALDMAAFSNSHYESINFVRYFSPMIHIVNPEEPWSTPFTLTTFFVVLLFTQITFKNVQERIADARTTSATSAAILGGHLHIICM